jgi:DNA polymerase I-like protein with 3'-5' exonuclease and polymerase domains
LGIDIETANLAYTGFINRYPKIAEARRNIFDMFCSMRQPNGIGTKVEWHTPKDYIESLFGFKRYFILENKISKALFELACNPPKEWKQQKVKVVRREREQTAFGATQSALYAAAFNMQSANMRAAANHVIQSSGAQITKRVQRRVWDLQPPGVHDWIVQPMNVHDELMIPTHPDFVNQVKDVVDLTVNSFRGTIPLIKMDWAIALKSWADK